MSGRNPPSYCTLTLIAMQGHQQKGRQTNTSSNNKDKFNTIIETSTAEDHDDENLHNPSTRPRYSPGSRRRAVGDHTRKQEGSGKNWVPRSITFLLKLKACAGQRVTLFERLDWKTPCLMHTLANQLRSPQKDTWVFYASVDGLSLGAIKSWHNSFLKSAWRDHTRCSVQIVTKST